MFYTVVKLVRLRARRTYYGSVKEATNPTTLLQLVLNHLSEGNL